MAWRFTKYYSTQVATASPAAKPSGRARAQRSRSAFPPKLVTTPSTACSRKTKPGPVSRAPHEFALSIPCGRGGGQGPPRGKYGNCAPASASFAALMSTSLVFDARTTQVVRSTVTDSWPSLRVQRILLSWSRRVFVRACLTHWSKCSTLHTAAQPLRESGLRAALQARRRRCSRIIGSVTRARTHDGQRYDVVSAALLTCSNSSSHAHGF